VHLRGLFLFVFQGIAEPLCANESPRFFNKKNAMHEDIHIGKLIVEKLKEKERTVAWLARQVHCDDANLGRVLKNSQHIHSELLLRISIALDEDFFAHYSEIVRKKT